MAHIASHLFIKALIIFLFGAFLGISSFGCSSKEKEPDAVALNSPLTPDQQKALDRGKQEEAKYGYNPPEASWKDSVGYKWNWLKNQAHAGAVTVGKLIATFVFHALLWLIPFLVIVFIPGFATGRAEMLIEGAILILAGIVMLTGNWIGELGVSHWVWFCLIIPGIVLIVSSFVTEEGWWKLGVVFGGQAIMTLVVFLGWVDTAMSALIHGSLFALACVAFIIYAFTRDDDKKGEAAESH
jgi:hypothetical protein